MQPHFLNPAIQTWPHNPPAYKGRAHDRLVEDLRFQTSWGEIITVPAGYISDGGSVPWWGRWLINPSHNQRAWWVHDWAWDQGMWNHARLLDEALLADNCPLWHRVLIVLAVKAAGALKLKPRRASRT